MAILQNVYSITLGKFVFAFLAYLTPISNFQNLKKMFFYRAEGSYEFCSARASVSLSVTLFSQNWFLSFSHVLHEVMVQ